MCARRNERFFPSPVIFCSELAKSGLRRAHQKNTLKRTELIHLLQSQRENLWIFRVLRITHTNTKIPMEKKFNAHTRHDDDDDDNEKCFSWRVVTPPNCVTPQRTNVRDFDWTCVFTLRSTILVSMDFYCTHTDTHTNAERKRDWFTYTMKIEKSTRSKIRWRPLSHQKSLNTR